MTTPSTLCQTLPTCNETKMHHKYGRVQKNDRKGRMYQTICNLKLPWHMYLFRDRFYLHDHVVFPTRFLSHLGTVYWKNAELYVPNG